MSTTAKSLSALLVRHRPARIQQGYPEWLKRRVGAFVRNERDSTNLTALAVRLGVSRTTLRAWSQLEPGPGGFAPVIVEQAVTTQLSEEVVLDEDFGIDLLTPDGFHLQGLSFEQSLRAVRALR